MKNRILDRGNTYYDHAMALELLKVSDSWGISLDDLKNIVFRARNWSPFRNEIEEAIEETIDREESE